MLRGVMAGFAVASRLDHIGNAVMVRHDRDRFGAARGDRRSGRQMGRRHEKLGKHPESEDEDCQGAVHAHGDVGTSVRPKRQSTNS